MTTLRLAKSNDRSLLRHAYPLLSLTFGFAWLALAPAARAVSPPPDGGYPNFTTAEGANALFSLTTGSANTAVGFFSLFSNVTGSFNTAVGAGALDLNTADNNTATGAAALLLNTTGTTNTATGVAALALNDTGSQNTANGFEALYSNTTGEANTATGSVALFFNTTGLLNTAIGVEALFSNTTGGSNTAGGVDALFSNITGSSNTAIGATALFSNTIGEQNTAIGRESLLNNATGNFNTATGVNVLHSNTTGEGNTANGFGALVNNTTGAANIALGRNAGSNLTIGNSNIDIGNIGVADESNTVRIGAGQTRTFIAGIRGKTTGIADAVPVLIDSAGQLGTMSSSRRFKNDIKPMDKASDALLALKPVTFHYKSDATGTPQFGLIAEEVAEVNPDLVVCDEKGEIYTVRYDAVNAMLVNEFLKEHRKVENLEATVAQQHKDLEAAVAELKGQIQKVSAPPELSKSAPQTVLNNQ